MQLEENQKKAIVDVLTQLSLIADEMEVSDTPYDSEELNQKVQTIIFLKAKEK